MIGIPTSWISLENIETVNVMYDYSQYVATG